MGVFRRGPPATHMIFVSNGTFVYRFRRLGRPHQLAKIGAGQFCCEHALWTDWSHAGNMKGLSQAEISRLCVAKFCTIVSALPAVGFQAASAYATFHVERMQQLVSFDRSYVSDLPLDGLACPADDSAFQKDLNEAEDADIKLLNFSDSEEEGDFEEEGDEDDDAERGG